jgi:hypothetical protein
MRGWKSYALRTGVLEAGRNVRLESKAGDSAAWNQQMLRKPEGEVMPVVLREEANHD